MRIRSVGGVFAAWLALLAAGPAAAQRWGGVREEEPILERYDRNHDGWLDAQERATALAAHDRGEWYGAGDEGWGGGWGGAQSRAASGSAAPVRKLKPAEVRRYGNEPLYDPAVLRTLFLQFDDADWERQLVAFKGTDVLVPATVSVDGRVYKDVGVHFHGNTSFSSTSDGEKRSMTLEFDWRHKDQDLLGYRSITLLNSAADPTFLRSVLFMQISRAYFPALKANFMRVAINGERWGVYVNQQHFNADFTREAVGARGARWKVPGSPRSRGGLEYFGEDVANYRKVFEIKGRDEPDSWQALIHLCKVLNLTPPEKLPAELPKVLDVDNVLRYMAIDNTLINTDGYWTRSSDYSIYRDGRGIFHIVAHDANETLRPLESGGFGGGRRMGMGGAAASASPGGTVYLDPLVAANDPTKPLVSRLLAVPAWKQKYLAYVRDINDKWLNWKTLGPIAQQYHALISADVYQDDHKLFGSDEFEQALSGDVSQSAGRYSGPTAPPEISLKSFVLQRHEWLAAWLEKH